VTHSAARNTIPPAPGVEVNHYVTYLDEISWMTEMGWGLLREDCRSGGLGVCDCRTVACQ
jgi:hypothetical protein